MDHKQQIYCDMDGVLCNLHWAAGRKLYKHFNLTNDIISEQDFYSFFEDLTSIYGRSTTSTFNTNLAKHYGIVDRNLLLFAKIIPNAVRSVLGDDEEFWATLPWMTGGPMLWKTIKDHNPIILSSPIHEGSRRGKMRWVRNELGPDVKVILTTNKQKFAREGDILIDDFSKYMTKWTEAGGLGILHKDPRDTIAHLNSLLNLS
tara:strand:- start:19882 stop:20490 length:609 start_codon:yes stop_codon:yes gene_type:complete